MKNSKVENLINAMIKSVNSAKFDATSKACTDYYLIASDFEKEKLKNAVIYSGELVLLNSIESKKKSEKLLAEINKPKTIIEVEGVKYPLTEWLTIKEYCNIYGLKTTSVVTNWTKRGVIPKENILYLPQLNLRLIKAEKYM